MAIGNSSEMVEMHAELWHLRRYPALLHGIVLFRKQGGCSRIWVTAAAPPVVLLVKHDDAGAAGRREESNSAGFANNNNLLILTTRGGSSNLDSKRWRKRYLLARNSKAQR